MVGDCKIFEVGVIARREWQFGIGDLRDLVHLDHHVLPKGLSRVASQRL